VRLAVVALEPEMENRLRAALVSKPDGPVLALAPDAIEAVAKALQAALQATADRGNPVLLLAPDVRRAISRLLRAQMPLTAFISHDELAASGVAPDVVAKAA
jgi:flagellar biosynthesis protein FlhA